jgi:hypothetical protein
MARIARVVAPGLPHHITQRGNRRQETFFCAEDYQAYIDLMREWCGYWAASCPRGARSDTLGVSLEQCGSPRGGGRRRAYPGGATAGVGGPLDGLSRHGRPRGRRHGTPPP